ETIRKSLEQNGFAAVCKDSASAIDFINEFGPEHLEIIAKNQDSIAKRVSSAGLVLVGPDSPSSASDYCLGSNHVLPTLGFARSRGSLSVLDFVKITNVVKASKAALRSTSRAIDALTYAEGLPNHFEAIKARLGNENKRKKKSKK